MKKYGFDFYEWRENIIDTKIFGQDELTFSVLTAIVNNKSAKVFTDGETVVICHSCNPWPVWAWVSQEVTKESLINAAECLAKEFSPEEGYAYNLSYELLEELKKINKVFRKVTIKTNMLTYRCDKILDVKKFCDGKARLATDTDIELLSRWECELHNDTEGLGLNKEECRKKVEGMIHEKSLWVWENGQGELVAMTSGEVEGKYSKVASVYTLPEARRKGYALHLVHRVTKEILEKGSVPILYTDADYPASNECYKKVGYKQVGSLCSVYQGDGV